MPRPRVQIADDHLMFAEPAGRYLSRHYHVLPPVVQLDEVAHALAREKPDVLLLDIAFGNRSALAGLARLVKAHPDTRIVMVTGLADRKMVARALDAGARGYVLKDDGPAELVVAIDTVLAGDVYLTAELRTEAPVARYRLKRPFSARQREVFELLRKGHSEQMIADDLDIALSTAEKHILAVKRRLGIDRHKRNVVWNALHVEGLG
jgi:DNA-binding NarL/FixJ family response regulator